MRSVHLAISLGSLLAATLSCAGASVTGSAPAAVPPPSASPMESTRAHVAWRDMNGGQRIDYMVRTVLPKMKAEFVAFDAKRFGRMDCATCHGDGAETGDYVLPNPKLPKLLETDLFAKHRAQTPAITQFMLQRVEPDLAALLEVPEFDPATRKGLSCYNCHPRELEPGKSPPPPAEHH